MSRKRIFISKMDKRFKAQLDENCLNYRRSLERIINKYSKCQYQEGALEVDLRTASTRKIQRYMKLAQMQMSELESKSLTDLRKEALRRMSSSDSTEQTRSTFEGSQISTSETEFQFEDQDEELEMSLRNRGRSLVAQKDVRKHYQSDFTYQDSEPDESRFSTSQFNVEDDGMSSSDSTEQTMTACEGSQISTSEMECQSEDQDEELEMFLRNRGRSLVEQKDVRKHYQSDFTYQDSEPDETRFSTSQFNVEDDGMSSSDSTEHTMSAFEGSQISTSEMEFKPEDQDEELEMSLRNQGNSLVEPSMITQMKKAWHRVNVSETADSVLRRYRNERYANSNPKKMTNETLLKKTFNRPLNSQQFPGISNRGAETAPLSRLRTVNKQQDWHTQRQSPWKERGTLRRDQQLPVVVMDLSCPSNTSEPKRSSLNETFTATQLSPPSFSQPEAQPSFYAVSPPQPHYPHSKSSLDLRRFPLSAHSAQTTGCAMYASGTTGVKERVDIYGSPVRQSPSKARMMTRESLGRSPYAFSRSPKSYPVNYSREPMRSRSMATFQSSPPQKPVMPLRMPHSQESHHCIQSQLSPLSGTAAGRHRLRQNQCFDSSLPQSRAFYSQKQLDDDYAKVYHKFICQNNSLQFNGSPCRMCARNSEASRGHSSSALAALALSPHHSVLRKRHRELDCDSYPQSKRSKDGYHTYTSGSKRHGKEMPRRRLTQEELEPCPNCLCTQQPSADAHQAARRPPGWPAPAAEFSGLGGSLESRMAAGHFPRKW